MRSASAPAISAGVMIANVIWKNMVDGFRDRRGQRIDRIQTHLAEKKLIETPNPLVDTRHSDWLVKAIE